MILKQKENFNDMSPLFPLTTRSVIQEISKLSELSEPTVSRAIRTPYIINGKGVKAQVYFFALKITPYYNAKIQNDQDKKLYDATVKTWQYETNKKGREILYKAIESFEV